MAKFQTDSDLQAFLQEHLKYEVNMLKFTFERVQACGAGYEWNAMFEAFGVHARNLYTFLRHEGSGTFRADDYLPNRQKPRALKGNAYTIIQGSLFHLSRTRLAGKKFDLADAKSLFDWIANEWNKWADALPVQFSKFAQPLRLNSGSMIMEGSRPSATNAIEMAGATTDDV